MASVALQVRVCSRAVCKAATLTAPIPMLQNGSFGTRQCRTAESSGGAQAVIGAARRGSGRHRLFIQGASRINASRACMQARRRAGLRLNDAPSATTAISSTSISREMPAAAASIVALE